jgi:hypothetical protein
MGYRLFDDTRGASIDIVFLEACLEPRRFPHGFGERAFAEGAAVENARLVEMDVCVDKSSEGEAAIAIDIGYGIAAEAGFDGRDPIASHCDINERAIFVDAHIADDEIEELV